MVQLTVLTYIIFLIRLILYLSGFPYLTLSSLDTDDIYTVLVYLLDAVVAQAYRVLLINFLKL